MNKQADTESSLNTCLDCETPLSSGICPTCALTELLGGENSKTNSGDAVPVPPSTARLSGEMFGSYGLLDRIGAGGMGVVYRAEDFRLNRTVALKMVRGSTFANDAELSRFTIEAEAAARLDHPNIVPIYEVGQIDNQPFYTMKLIEGESLADRIGDTSDSTNLRGAISLLTCIARAVQHAHQHGVLHRDIKPGNILIDRTGLPWLTDFGLAKLSATDSSVTLSSDHLGTPDYMAPEVAGGNVREASTASDVWALGVILWEIIFGVRPFKGSGTVETLRRIVEEEPNKPRGISANDDLVTLARRCLEKDPARRLDSAGELADELDRWSRGEPIQARRITGGERLVKWVRRNPTWAALYGALLTGVIVSIFFWQRAESAVDDLSATNERLEEALDIANSRKLAVDARLEVKQNPSRALLLAVEAVERGEKIEGSVLREGAESLISVLQQVGGTDVSTFGPPLADPNDGYVSRGFLDYLPPTHSPNGRWLFTLDYTDLERGVYAAVFDLQNNDQSKPVIRWKLWEEFGHPSAFYWSPDSKYIFALNHDGVIKQWGPFAKAPTGNIDRSPPSKVVGDVNIRNRKIAHVRTCPQKPEGPMGFGLIYSEHGISHNDPDVYPWYAWSGFDDESGKFSPADSLELIPLPFGYANDTGVTISPDGRWLLLHCTHGRDPLYLVDVLNPENGFVQLPESPFFIECPVFSDDGNWLAFIRRTESVRIYDLRSGSIQAAAATGRDALPGTTHGTYLDISPDSRFVSVATGKSEIITYPIDPESNANASFVRFDGGECRVVRFSEDSRMIAAGGLDRTVQVWDVASLTKAPDPKIFRGLPSPVIDIDFSPDSQEIIASGVDCLHRRWKIREQGTLPKVLPGSRGQIIEVAVSPDKEWIATGGTNKTTRTGFVKITKTNGKGQFKLATHGSYCTDVAFSRDGKWFASTGLDGMVNVWDFPAVTAAVESGKRPPSPSHILSMEGTRLIYHRKLEFHPRGTLYCACGDGILFEWDLDTTAPADTEQLHVIHSIKYLLPDIRISPDGRTMAVCRHGWDIEPREGSFQHTNMVLLFDVSKEGPPVRITELPSYFLDYSTVEFSPDSRWVACGSSGRGVDIWDLHAEDIAGSVRTSLAKAHRLTGVSFNPNGRELAFGGSDGRIHLWNWQSHSDSDYITIQDEDDIASLVWLDEHQLVSGGEKGVISIWETDLNRLKLIARKTAGRPFSKDERERFQIPD